MIRRFFGSTVRSGFNMLDYNPAVWLDAEDAGSVILISGKVSQWSDKSGNLNHAVQTDAAMRPLYGVSAVSNGFPSIDITDIGGIGFLLSNQIPISEIIMVMAYKTGVENITTDYHTIISGPGTAGSPNRIMMNQNNNNFYSSTMSETVYKNGGTETSILLPLPLTVCNFRTDAKTASILWSLYKNSDPNFSTRNWIGHVSETILFENQLAAADRTDIVNHLIAKWGIS